MTALDHKLWIESYEASTEHTSAEDDIYLCIGYWQDRIDRGESRQQMLFAGCDPDMLNEYAMAMDLYWPEIDAHYDQTNPLHQAICKYKKQRATAIQEHRDPGAIPEKVQKYFTLAKKSERTAPAAAQTAPAKPAARQPQAVAPRQQPQRAAQPKQQSSAPKTNRKAKVKSAYVGNPKSLGNKELTKADYSALKDLSYSNFFWSIDRTDGGGNEITFLPWLIGRLTGAFISIGDPCPRPPAFLMGMLLFVDIGFPVMGFLGGDFFGMLKGTLPMIAFTVFLYYFWPLYAKRKFFLGVPFLFDKQKAQYNDEFTKRAWWHNTGIAPSEIVKDKGTYGEYIATMVAEQNMEKYKLRGKVFNNVLVPMEKGDFRELDVVVVNETGIHVIEAKCRSGELRGAYTDPKWAQVLGSSVNEMDNPLYQNQDHINHLAQYLYDHLPEGSTKQAVGDCFIYLNVALLTGNSFELALDSRVTPRRYMLCGAAAYRDQDFAKAIGKILSDEQISEICNVLASISGYSEEEKAQMMTIRERGRQMNFYKTHYTYAVVDFDEYYQVNGQTERETSICKIADNGFTTYMNMLDGWYYAVPNAKIVTKIECRNEAHAFETYRNL